MGKPLLHVRKAELSQCRGRGKAAMGMSLPGQFANGKKTGDAGVVIA